MPSQKLDIKCPADIRMFLAERQKLGQMGAAQPTSACIQCMISECLIMVSHQHRLAHMHQLEIQTPPGRHTVRWLAQYRRQQHHVTTKHQLNAKLYQHRMHQTPQHARLPRLLSTPGQVVRPENQHCQNQHCSTHCSQSGCVNRRCPCSCSSQPAQT